MRLKSFYFRRLMVAALLVGLIFCLVQVMKPDVGFMDNEMSNADLLLEITKTIKDSVADFLDMGDGVPACKAPVLDVLNAEILKFLHDVPPLKCDENDWVVAEGSKLLIVDKIKNHYGSITCAFSEILRVDDSTTKHMKPVESDDFYILKHSDYADVKCESKNGKQWHSVLAGVKEDPAAFVNFTWDKASTNPHGLKVNVLMFGFDSLSRNTFIRKLPKTYMYIKNNLDAQVLEGYNIVGDGTPQALIPILTGKTELELPEVRKRMGDKANHVDVYPMIWKNYKDNGYITGFLEDVPKIGTFTYRLKGFDKQPTDHYMRTYYLAAEPLFKYSKKFCLAGQPRHMLMMNHIKNIFNTYRDQPKFLFGFHGELSHDSYNDIGVADEDLHQWVKDLEQSGHLNNTILILMSDHGHRFAAIRNTLQGKQEERLPFFAFIFPPWFKQVHPKAYANFVYNTHHLSTPFDVHRTLEAILKFDTPKEGDKRERAISLFDKIPLERTCADAFIEPHWCACMSWQEVPIGDPNVALAADSLIHLLNSYTDKHRKICDILSLEKILWSSKLTPTKALLKFKKSGDRDGFVGDFSDKTDVKSEVYQIKVKTRPGDGLFEASVNHNVTSKTFKTEITSVSRINKYGSQARCVENEFHDLRKYCHCKD